ncbi:uncharacterized protein LOC124281880 [Haliotis rubra]|uniref:uncharacterized protein LOC124281880 n=1 Tax=Haliotis rubra TaxID=36100 RepID=UPI001EE526F0|nr:uncharacterized protein LOC124281880 [Haliotis rubra]
MLSQSSRVVYYVTVQAKTIDVVRSGKSEYTSFLSKGLLFSTTKMLLLPFLAMATHEIKKLMALRDPDKVPNDDLLVRGVYVVPGQPPSCMPYHLDDLIPSPTDPNNHVCDDCRSAANIYCPPVWTAMLLCRHARTI